MHHRWESADEPTASSVDDARAEVDLLASGLSRALLAMPPREVRRLASSAARAEAAVARWQARVGERPELSTDADAAVVTAVDDVKAARIDHDAALFERHKVLAIGNVMGLSALAAAAGLVALGVPPMDLPVGVAVVSAAGGPLAAAWLATQRCSLASRNLGTARRRWASALDATGAGTMGELAARRVAVAAWERRCREAAAAADAARPHQRAWYRVAGPGVSPLDVDDVLSRIELLRRAQLRLFAALLEARVERSAMAVLAPPDEVAAPSQAPTWLDDALSRLRGNRLRLWR
jgi:hypothetical protein